MMTCLNSFSSVRASPYLVVIHRWRSQKHARCSCCRHGRGLKACRGRPTRGIAEEGISLKRSAAQVDKRSTDHTTSSPEQLEIHEEFAKLNSQDIPVDRGIYVEYSCKIMFKGR